MGQIKLKAVSSESLLRIIWLLKEKMVSTTMKGNSLFKMLPS